jgi:hypothetical protein
MARWWWEKKKKKKGKGRRWRTVAKKRMPFD